MSFSILPPSSSLFFQCSWDYDQRKPVDLDVQCVLVNRAGSIVDAVYYNNLKGRGGGVTHSGDEKSGMKEGVDEKISVFLGKVAEEVQLIIFMVFCHSGGTFQDVLNGQVEFVSPSSPSPLSSLPLSSLSDHSAAIVGTLNRAPSLGGWAFMKEERRIGVGEGFKPQHFLDCLEGISECISLFVPSAPRKQKIAFSMSKGSSLPIGGREEKVRCGLGWDTDMGEVDLDASAVLFDFSGNFVESVFFGNLESCNPSSGAPRCIVHSGDNLTGEGEGDDELISLDLSRIGPQIAQIFLIINIYSPGKCFKNVSSPYCRVMDGQGAEMCRYSLASSGSSSGLVISRFIRSPPPSPSSPPSFWRFQALGVPADGRTFKDSLPAMQQLFWTQDLASAPPPFSSSPLSPPPILPSPPGGKRRGGRRGEGVV